MTSARAFDRWWSRTRRDRPDLLTYTRADLIDPAAGPVDGEAFPTTWHQGDRSFDVTYTFGPGADDDGVTVHVPLAVLNEVTPDGFDWQVPGHRLDLVTALVRSLPKGVRRRLVPAPDRAREALAGIDPTGGPLLDVLARRLAQLTGEAVAPDGLRPRPRPRPPARPVPGHRRRRPGGGGRARPGGAAAGPRPPGPGRGGRAPPPASSAAA